MHTKQRAFEAAVALIEHDGASALSMRRLADEIDVTPMALYRHYTNRQALLDAIADHYFNDLAVRWRTITDTRAYAQALLDIGADLVDFYLLHPNLYQTMFIDPRNNARRLSADTGSDSPTFSIIVENVQKGIAEGTLQGNSAPEIALALAAQLHGLIALRQGGRLSMSEPQFRSFCKQALIHALSAYQYKERSY